MLELGRHEVDHDVAGAEDGTGNLPRRVRRKGYSLSLGWIKDLRLFRNARRPRIHPEPGPDDGGRVRDPDDRVIPVPSIPSTLCEDGT
jgi:hypothetical protein